MVAVNKVPTIVARRPCMLHDNMLYYALLNYMMDGIVLTLLLYYTCTMIYCTVL